MRDLSARMKVRMQMTPQDGARLLNHLKGLTLLEAEKVLTKAIVEDNRLSIDDIAHVVAAKKQIVEQEAVAAAYQARLASATVGQAVEMLHPAIRPPWNLALAVEGGQSSTPDLYEQALSAQVSPELRRIRSANQGNIQILGQDASRIIPAKRANLRRRGPPGGVRVDGPGARRLCLALQRRRLDLQLCALRAARLHVAQEGH